MMLSQNQQIDLDRHFAQVAADMRVTALTGTFDGRPRNMAYVQRCRFIDDVTGTTIIFSRDTEHHTSGWMKNPEFERCYHLSLSRTPSRIIVPGRQVTDLDAESQRRWLRAFFGDDARKTWLESAKSTVGIRIGVLHWRLFCDEHWQPIQPRGEVYSTELTELGWKSASQLFEEEGRVVMSTLDPT